MKIYKPSYYDNFKCIKGECRHTCCALWEVEIDKSTLEGYKKLDTPLGKRIRASIENSADTVHFKLTENKKCPFLNSSGLCDIICEMGEGAVPEICQKHPRFLNLFSDRVEICLGASCEEVARIIVSSTEIPRLILEDTSDTQQPRHIIESESEEPLDFEKRIFSLREKMTSFIYKNEITVGEAFTEFLSPFGIRAELLIPLTSAFLELEYIDKAFFEYVKATQDATNVLSHHLTREDKNIIAYLILRHISPAENERELALETAFVLLSTLVILSVLQSSNTDPCEILRLFSEEVEYSTDNMEYLLSTIDFELSFA